MARKTADTGIPKPIDWEAEKTFVGHYVKTNYDIPSVNGPFDSAVLQDEDGERRSAPLSVDLKRGMEQVPPGARVWITYKGKESIGGGKSVKRFDVDYDDEDTIDVPHPAPRSAPRPEMATDTDPEPF